MSEKVAVHRKRTVLLVKVGEGSHAKTKDELAMLARSHVDIISNAQQARDSDKAIIINGYEDKVDLVIRELAEGWAEAEYAP